MMAARTIYHAGFAFADGAVMASGLGYNGTDKNGKL